MVILGFGTTETSAALDIIEECRRAIASNPDTLQAAIAAIEIRYREVGDKYNAMNPDAVPQRYTYFWALCSKLENGGDLIEFTMHHINRCHALSPDGCAMLMTYWILSVRPSGEWRIYKAERVGEAE